MFEVFVCLPELNGSGKLYWNKGRGVRSFTQTTFDPPNDLRECCNVIYLHAHHLNRRLKESPRV